MPLTHTHAADQVAVIAQVDPEAQGAATVVSGWADAGEFHTFMAVIQVGDMATNSTVDAKIRQATDSSGTGAKDITGAAITQVTQAGTDGSNQQYVISVQNDALDVANGFDHVAISITVGTAASDLSATLLGCSPRVGPADDNDASTVTEVVRA